MLPLELFRSHNFSAVNLATLCVYAGLIGSSFFITLYLQQVAGYTPFQAGAAGTPITILMLLLSGRFGGLASRIGPRIPMGVGPVISAAGLALLLRLDTDPNYLTDIFPYTLLFGVGLAMTVAPLTTTVLDSVEERHMGIGSGVNNAVARVAGLLAIAALGAIVSAQFASSIDEKVGDRPLSPQAERTIDDAKAQPLTRGDVSDVPPAEADELDSALVDSSVSAFHFGILISIVLMVIGGLISLVWVQNPERRPERPPERGPGPAATAGECGRSGGPDHEAPEPAAA
jgi:hypothetical protein